MNTNLLPTYEEYNQKVVKLFINNCLLDVSQEERKNMCKIMKAKK